MKLKLNVFLFFLFSCVISEAQTTEFYGMTVRGGTDNLGVIFKTDENGENQTIEHDFLYNNPGLAPDRGKLCDANGKLYGTTTSGGKFNGGVLYEFDPITTAYIKRYDFTFDSGYYPHSNLIFASNGKLYGTTSGGGSSDVGVLFEFDLTTHTVIKKFDFNVSLTGYSNYRLIQVSNGKLYGLATAGGLNNSGTLFEYDYDTEILIKLIDFDVAAMGRSPHTLIETEDNILHGVCSSGGNNDLGTIFKYDILTNTLTKTFDFDRVVSGAHPLNYSFIKASSGILYGFTASGGANSAGVFYEYNTTTETYTKKFDLNEENNGGYMSGFMEANNGKLYVLNFSRAMINTGGITEFDPTKNEFTKKYDFIFENGKDPAGHLVQAANGKLYGTAERGGVGYSSISYLDSPGVLFEYDIVTEEFEKKVDFNYTDLGTYIIGSLLKADHGKLYGAMRYGGSHNSGTLISLDPYSQTLVKLHDFNNDDEDNNTPANLMLTSNNKLYGTSETGIIFEYDIQAATMARVFDLGAYTFSNGFIELPNGNLFGAERNGGIHGGGMLFEFDTSNHTLTNKYDFETATSGFYPIGNLILSNNKVYGFAGRGGENGVGVLFEYNLDTGAYSKKVDNVKSFGDVFLMQAGNKKIYGTTYSGGTNNSGSIFEYNIETNTLETKISFDGDTTGRNPKASLMQARNGKLYGTSSSGGMNGKGALFEYDTVTEILNKKFDFTGDNGGNPFGTLVEVDTNPLSIDTPISLNGIRIYPNPVVNDLTISLKNSKSFGITIFNILGNQVFYKIHVDNNEQIKLSQLQSGLYILKATSEDGAVDTIKFIKN